MAKNVAEIILKLDDRISKGLGVVGSKLENTVSQLEKIDNKSKSFEKLRTGALIAGGAIAVGLGMATAKAVQFESSLAPVKTVLSGTADEVEQASSRIGKHALSWSSQYAHSSEEYLGASYNLLSAGLNEQQAIAGTNMALKLATATLGDATTSSALLGTLYNNFGDKAGDANTEMLRLSDTVAKTQQLFQIANLGQLNEGLKYATSSALAFGVSFDQTSAVVGQLNTLGITGSMAGTSFNAMMRTLSKGSQDLGYEIARTSDGGIDLVKTLRNISEVGADANTIQKVFGDEGAKGINLLTAKIGDLEGNFAKVQNSMGATETAFQKINNTTKSQLMVTMNNLAVISTAIGNGFMWMLGGILSFVNPVLQAVSHLVMNHQWFANIIGIVSVVLAGLLLSFGSYVFWVKSATMISGLWSAALAYKTVVIAGVQKALLLMNSTILANPMGLVIAMAVGALAWLMTNIEWVLGGWQNLMTYLRNFGGVFEWLANLFDATIGKLLHGLKWIVDKFKELFGFTGQSLPEYEKPIINKLPELEQKITPTFVPSKGLGKLETPAQQSLNNEVMLPITHTNFMNKNGLGGEITPAGSRNTFAKSIHGRKSTQSALEVSDSLSSKNSSTSIHIDKVEIADGVIASLDDFINSLKNRVTA